MELRHLRYFLAVAQEASFTRAALKLGIGQPPLSQQIKQLETEMNVRLFDRTAHGVRLTIAGTAFAADAQRVLDDTQRAIRAAQRAHDGETGTLRVGFTSSAAFNPVVAASIKRFRRNFPQAELSLEEANTFALLDALDKGSLDAVFLRPGTGPLGGLDLHRFADEAMRIVVPSDHRLAQQASADIAELKGEPFVLFPRAAGISLYEEVFEACLRAGFSPVLAQIAPQISSVINLVAAGLGVSIVPAAIASVLVESVRYLPISGPGPAPVARLALVTRPDNQGIMVRNFLGLLD